MVAKDVVENFDYNLAIDPQNILHKHFDSSSLVIETNNRSTLEKETTPFGEVLHKALQESDKLEDTLEKVFAEKIYDVPPRHLFDKDLMKELKLELRMGEVLKIWTAIEEYEKRNRSFDVEIPKYYSQQNGAHTPFTGEMSLFRSFLKFVLSSMNASIFRITESQLIQTAKGNKEIPAAADAFLKKLLIQNTGGFVLEVISTFSDERQQLEGTLILLKLVKDYGRVTLAEKLEVLQDYLSVDYGGQGNADFWSLLITKKEEYERHKISELEILAKTVIKVLERDHVNTSVVYDLKCMDPAEITLETLRNAILNGSLKKNSKNVMAVQVKKGRQRSRKKDSKKGELRIAIDTYAGSTILKDDKLLWDVSSCDGTINGVADREIKVVKKGTLKWSTSSWGEAFVVPDSRVECMAIVNMILDEQVQEVHLSKDESYMKMNIAGQKPHRVEIELEREVGAFAKIPVSKPKRVQISNNDQDVKQENSTQKGSYISMGHVSAVKTQPACIFMGHVSAVKTKPACISMGHVSAVKTTQTRNSIRHVSTDKKTTSKHNITQV